MGVFSSSIECDAVASPGYPADYTGEQALRLQALAKHASETFAPPFVHPTGPEKPLVPTKDGNRAMALGASAVARAPKVLTSKMAIFSSFPFSKERVEQELGGLESVFTVFATHYRRMFEDPRMSVLFDTRHADTNVSALEHGKRIGSAMLDEWFGTTFFASLGRKYSSARSQIAIGHRRAKDCPMRPAKQRGARYFTVAQRNTWLGYAWMGAEDAGASKEFCQGMVDWLAGNLGFMDFQD